MWLGVFLRGKGYLGIGMGGFGVAETVMVGSRGGGICSGGGYLGFGLGRRMFEKKTTSKTKKKKRKTKWKRNRRVRISHPHRRAYGFRSVSRLSFSSINYSVLMLIMLLLMKIGGPEVKVNPDVIGTLEEDGLKFVGKDESGK
ncbi:hypothetical protein D0Y65_030692 [Glycine soja]|uniref:Uncharacterized protein n=1 Tax=Glycine soja TaxID=3848 RepID=A0A445I4N4_GLYSO|nr:hypothetical protein D0Y65_030692 [Glycine soja]